MTEFTAGQVYNADSIPRDGTQILAWWPMLKLDEYGDLTTELVDGDIKGSWVPTQWEGGWAEPDWFEATGGFFGDDYEYAPEPTHWSPLPATPTLPLPGAEGIAE